jgi:hypothetical protein
MSVDELRTHLGLEEGQLLTNDSGELADILEIEGEYVWLGVLSRRDPIKVPLHSLARKRQSETVPHINL